MNITDASFRRILLTNGVSITYYISNQNKSSSSVLAILTAAALDGSFALLINNKLTSQGYSYSLAAAAPVILNPVLISSVAPTFSPTSSPISPKIQSSSKDTNIPGLIGGSIAGAVAALLALSLTLYYLHRRHRRKCRDT